VFPFFFDCFCRFCFRFLSVFLVFESNLTKSKNCKKHRVFHFSIFFEPKRQFQFIFELFLNPKNVNFQFIFELDGIVELFSNLKHLLIFFSPLPVRLPQWSSRPWQDLLQQAKSHVLGTFRDDGKLTSYSFNKNRRWFCDVLGDDENDNKLKKNMFLDFQCVASWNCHNVTHMPHQFPSLFSVGPLAPLKSAYHTRSHAFAWVLQTLKALQPSCCRDS